MGILEGLLYLLWRGLAIGVIISAPMGPVGILCIQRTLDKGRHAGFYTGVGAALSDLVYCLLTGFGLSFVEEFLEKNSDIIQLLGSVVLIAFGVYLFKSNPSQSLKKATESQVSASRCVLNGFLFTFSNPLIIFLIIGLFARFNFLLPDFAFYHYMIGFAGIIGGALLWWFMVTWFVAKVRSHFNLRSMWLINKIIGTVILIFAVVGIVTASSSLIKIRGEVPAIYQNSGRSFNRFGSNSDSVLVVSAGRKSVGETLMPIGGSKDFEWSFRVSASENQPLQGGGFKEVFKKKKKRDLPVWGIVLRNGKQVCRIGFRTIDEDSNIEKEGERVPALRVQCENNGKILFTKNIYKGWDFYAGWNALMIKFADGSLSLSGGNREYTPIADGIDIGFIPTEVGYYVSRQGKLKVNHIAFLQAGIGYNDSWKSIPEDELKTKLRKRGDKIEGEWLVYDHQIESKSANLGGEYRLAIIKDKNDQGELSYQIVYLNGAQRRSDIWCKGMIKGRLISTPFKNIYNAEWIDAGGNKVADQVKAEFESPFLRIVFPRLNSEMRLRKVD